MKHLEKQETGQSIVIIVIAVVILAALAAIVVDVGYSYVQQRQVQNATDAASMAGSLALAQKQQYGQIATIVKQYLQTNGITDISGVKGYFIVQDNAGNTHILNGQTDPLAFPCTSQCSYIPPATMTYQGVALPVVGIHVDAGKQFNTFFAGAIGFKQVQVNANSAGHINTSSGPCSTSNVFPLALSVKHFPTDGQGKPVINYQQTNPTAQSDVLSETYYTKDAHGNLTPVTGDIGYLTWRGAPSNGSTDHSVLALNMNTVTRSGEVGVTSTANPGLAGSAGTMADSDVYAALGTTKINGVPVILPIYDSMTGSGGTAVYHIVGFASFLITDIQRAGTLSTDQKKIIGRFQLWTDPQASGGCMYFGGTEPTPGCTVDCEPPNRTIAGTVTFLPVYPYTPPTTTTVSADVAFVLDTSGSMINTFGTDHQQKIVAAQNAIVTFINNLKTLNTTKGYSSQVGFVHFPQVADTSSNKQACANDWNSPVTSQKYEALTARDAIGTSFTQVITDVKATTPLNGTPMALGLRAGTDIVLGAGHNTNNVPVIILATDGMPNGDTQGSLQSGLPTGYSSGWNGNISTSNVTPLPKNPDGTYTYPSCNNQAANDTYAAANSAKQNGVIIFTIGTGQGGTDFDASVLKAIATPDSAGQQHYFTASDSAGLNAAYSSIISQTVAFGCSPRQKEPDRAAGAVLTIKNSAGQTLTGPGGAPIKTGANGEFIVSGVANDTYTITGITFTDPTTGVPYQQFSDSGGKPVTNPTVYADVSSDTYRNDSIYVTTAKDVCQP
jgi:hypothetical protein